MAETPGAGGEDARVRALAEELGAQLGRLRAGPKLTDFLAMLRFDPARTVAGPSAGDGPVGIDVVRRTIEQDLGARVRSLFAELDEEPLATGTLGQVHRARTREGDEVVVKVQRPGVAEAIDADLRNLGFAGPILRRLAPGVDAGAVLAEIRERITEEIDYEIVAQHQRRVERLGRGHPHVRLPRVHTALSARRVLVTEYVEGLRLDAIERLGDAERDRIGEIAFRFYFGLVWRHGLAAGDPHPGHCILCPDGRLCLLGFGLLRDLDAAYLEGERAMMRALAARDRKGVHDGLAGLGYLPEREPVDDDVLLEHLAAAGEWMLADGFRRLDPGYAARTLELAYPPRSPYLASMRRLRIPSPTLLLRRTEVRVLALLGDLRAGADWGAITAEHHSDHPAATALGLEEQAFHARRRS